MFKSLLLLLVLVFQPPTLKMDRVFAQEKSVSGHSPQSAKAGNQSRIREVDILSPGEEAILSEINLARSNPPQYAQFLKQFKEYYKGKSIQFPDGYTIVTNENAGAVDEAIQFLQKTKPLPPLEIRRGMVLGAKDHAIDLVRNGKTGHRGSDGSVPEDRLSRYGTWSLAVGEDIVYHSRSAREAVVGLIIDDGLASRAHRNNVFKTGFHVIGIALGPPATSGTICVITFAGDFADQSNSRTDSGKAPAAKKY
jgi:uncharacterized protein YkwD